MDISWASQPFTVTRILNLVLEDLSSLPLLQLQEQVILRGTPEFDQIVNNDFQYVQRNGLIHKQSKEITQLLATIVTA